MSHPPQDVFEKAVRHGGGDHSALGQWGERKAAEYLQSQGYRLLDTRFRCREGEIDLILSREPYLCFVEVKLRKDADMAQARESVTPAKQRKVRTAPLRYLSQHPTRLQPRFDVIEIYAPQGVETVLPTIYHLENAF